MKTQILGQKRKRLYTEFISKFIPKNIKTFIEPFSGSFAVATYLFEDRINENMKFIYNDINYYNLTIYADKIHHLDYKEIFKMYDSVDSVFYCDPPYVSFEHLYDNCQNFNHEELRDEILKLKGKVIISYREHKIISKLYKDFNIHKYNGDNFIFRNEIIITNF